ncbi:MAG: hypothetical protein CUN51_06865 [Candidatus Thermofonsia Clade 1 bacterium]|uniref:Methyltransferase domain-containing protein n=1 Tax=Candidatus Thermofonsia Clade 1 bacterium TaxID=2364210 RepID=A0A2M8NZH6_9CHLR|nr:MAG: hypothetical protein CUN51_06865 [Candidatus Thermofonsia Clade 1 bacterium]
MRHIRHYAISDGRYLERLFALVQPSWRVLEIGCSSGCISLEMARRGAHVEGIDVSAEAISVAQAYAAEHPPCGNLHYRVADINCDPLPEAHYDLIVALGVLPHLVDVRAALERIRTALKPRGLLYVSDFLETPTANALIVGAFTMLLPAEISYRDKIRHLLRLRTRAVERMKASMETRGFSPFEGSGRHQNSLETVRELFDVEWLRIHNAFVRPVTANLAMPERLAVLIGRLLLPFDELAVRLRLLQGLSYKLIARRP